MFETMKDRGDGGEGWEKNSNEVIHILDNDSVVQAMVFFLFFNTARASEFVLICPSLPVLYTGN